MREKDYRRVIKICLGSMNLKRGLSRCISKCSLHRLSHQTRHANTQKTWRAYIQTNTRALRGTVLSYCPWPIFPFLECLFFTSARSTSTHSTSSTLILDRCPASFPAILLELLAGIGDVETEISSGERAAFSGPELGAVIVSSPEAWWALVKKTYDPTILV